jgi:hypothetical protein
MDVAGQRSWVEAMELDTLTPDLPQLLKEMGGWWQGRTCVEAKVRHVAA